MLLTDILRWWRKSSIWPTECARNWEILQPNRKARACADLHGWKTVTFGSSGYPASQFRSKQSRVYGTLQPIGGAVRQPFQADRTCQQTLPVFHTFTPVRLESLTYANRLKCCECTGRVRLDPSPPGAIEFWLTHSDGLFLVYTRKDASNANVIRWRSPLWAARVDTERLCLIRQSEQIVLPLVGDGVNNPDEVALMGNFNVTNVSPYESWVTVGEWIPRRGAKGDLLMSRIRWSRPNSLAPDLTN